MQGKIKLDPVHGFWLVSVAAFVVSPFLTNDGVCLLFVEPILNAFESLPANNINRSVNCTATSCVDISLVKSDAIYFLLALACSSNIGSALTYTGNPQNMIVAGDSLSVLSPLRFLGYMILPSTLSFVVTTLWIQRIWIRSRTEKYMKLSGTNPVPSPLREIEYTDIENNGPLMVNIDATAHINSNCGTGLSHRLRRRSHEPLLSPFRVDVHVSSPKPLMADEGAEKRVIASKVVKVLMVPFPYAMLLMMGIMIALIFVDLISISGLVCITACVMVVTLVLGNHYRGINIWGTMTAHSDSLHESSHHGGPNIDVHDSPHVNFESSHPTVDIESMNQFFEELFDSIDYNLLLIFLGLFVVVENLGSTGIPKMIWNRIVGRTPFDTIASVTGISFFVLIASQFLGNVAVCQLIKPNVEILDDDARRYAWAVISFVATIGGNLTLPGSAANIIVAEKAARIDSSAAITFFNHFAVCFFITLFCCGMGAILITGLVICDNGMIGMW